MVGAVIYAISKLLWRGLAKSIKYLRAFNNTMSERFDIYTSGVLLGLKQAIDIMELKGNDLKFNLRVLKSYYANIREKYEKD